jgi:hypothetical protein
MKPVKTVPVGLEKVVKSIAYPGRTNYDAYGCPKRYSDHATEEKVI